MESIPNTAPHRVAGLLVKAIVYYTMEPWSTWLYDPDPFYVLENGALVSTRATIGEDVEIGFGTMVMYEAKIGDRVKLGAMVHIGDSVTIGDRTVVGDRTMIDHGATLGASCKIGSAVFIGSLNDLPDGTVLTDQTIIMHETLEGDESFLTGAELPEKSAVIYEANRPVFTVDHQVVYEERPDPETPIGQFLGGPKDTRYAHALQRGGVKTVGDLLEMTADDLLALDQVAEGTLAVVVERLRGVGLQLKQS